MRLQKPFFRTLLFLFLLICLLSGLVGVVQAPVKAAPQFIYPASSVVISEFRTRGPGVTAAGAATDEFVELYNPTANPIDITGWKINGSNNAAGISTRATIPAVTLQSG